MANSKEDLLESKTFCMLPWVHMHLWPNGNTYPCCIWNSDISLGQFNSTTGLMDLWNSPRMKELRVNMLSGRPTEGCQRCYVLEEGGMEHTLRLSSNRIYPHNWDLVEKTKPDGHLDEIRFSYLDIRFNNLCNLKCQTCGPDLSSSWFEDQSQIDKNHSSPKVIQISPTDKLWRELEPLLMNVENAYFAGGEPLICDEQYQILDLWTKHEKFDIPINYTTNFMLLTHKKARILDYWKRFNNVSVSASLDDSGPRAEYLRKGTVWENIVRNRKKMMEECPNVHFEITPTISAYNAFHFPEFHWEWVEQGLIKPNDIRLNILTHQAFMSVRILPVEMKLQIKEKWETYLKKIQDYAWSRGLHAHQSEWGYKAVINFMMEKDDTHLLKEFFRRASQVDSIRSEKLFNIYPELKEAYFHMRLEGRK